MERNGYNSENVIRYKNERGWIVIKTGGGKIKICIQMFDMPACKNGTNMGYQKEG